tara:strand:+ start:276 stop:839 length:564 start_codon:yes stop_codon:yes gene_type:complete
MSSSSAPILIIAGMGFCCVSASLATGMYLVTQGEEGCMDPNANNYSSTATSNLSNTCTFDYGCMDPNANNYSSTITSNLASMCKYNPVVGPVVIGCMIPFADNYISTAKTDDPDNPCIINYKDKKDNFDENVMDGPFCNSGDLSDYPPGATMGSTGDISVPSFIIRDNYDIRVPQMIYPTPGSDCVE